MDFGLLGPLAVTEQHRTLSLGGVKQRSLLALLLLHANEVVGADRLIGELWGQRPRSTAGKIVQVCVSRLRKQLGHDRLAPAGDGHSVRLVADRGRAMSLTLDTGSTFAGYRVEELIGRGGMGVVYRATDLSLQRPVALKLIAPELADDERFRRRFLKEPRLAASLDHPNVIPIYDAGEHDGHLYLAMRYVHGDDLKTVLRRERALMPERALRILGPIAAALDAAHRRGLVHRDVKPANVLLDEDEHPYLTDFGITKRAGGRVDRHRARGRHARLPGARADPRRAGRRAQRPVRARVRAVRVPGGRAAIPARDRGRDAVGAPAGGAAAAGRPPGARPGAAHGARQGEGRALRHVRRADGCGASGARARPHRRPRAARREDFAATTRSWPQGWSCSPPSRRRSRRRAAGTARSRPGRRSATGSPRSTRMGARSRRSSRPPPRRATSPSARAPSGS